MKKIRIIILLLLVFSVFSYTKKAKAIDINQIKDQTSKMEQLKNDIIQGKKSGSEYIKEKEFYISLLTQMNEEVLKINEERERYKSQLASTNQELKSALIYIQSSRNQVGVKITQNDTLKTRIAQKQISEATQIAIQKANENLAELEIRNQKIEKIGKEVEYYSNKIFKQSEELQNAGKIEKNNYSYENLDMECGLNSEASETCKEYRKSFKGNQDDSAQTLSESIEKNGISSIRSNNLNPKSLKNTPVSSPTTPNVEKWNRPAGVITQAYGCAFWENAFYPSGQGCAHLHNGMDFSSGLYSSISASRSGVVVKAVDGCYDSYSACGGGWGNNVVIQHDVNGVTYYSQYAHLAQGSVSVSVSVGQSIQAGNSVGLQGNSGFSKGSHLHFSIYRGSYNVYTNSVNPASLF